MYRFVHASDLHIGKRFGNFPEDLRGRLREARHGAIGRLARQATAHGAAAILLAGDTFDTETPTPAMLHQALAEMGRHDGLSWVILPGNHDSLLADELWRGTQAIAPPNVTLALAPRPIELAPGAMLLPAPCTARRPGRDLTEWMSDAPSAPGALRIGLAHGPVLDFSEDGVGGDVIAPDRARRAGLDYLALGDWHGQMRLSERSYYSGTPEPDRFKHDRPGTALLVSLAGAGALPEVTALPVGEFAWRTRQIELIGGDDGLAGLDAILPAPAERRQTLLRLELRGHASMGGRMALNAAIDRMAPELAHVERDESGLVTACAADDLDRIDRAGALRQAAETLLAESTDTDRPLAEREIAEAALVRLFTYCQAADA